MRAGHRLAWVVLAAVTLGGTLAAQSVDRRQLERMQRTIREEGEAVLALADAAAGEQALPADFALEWHNDFFKARQGTFIPFIVRITPPRPGPAAALLYVRAVRQPIADRDDNRAARPRDPAGRPPYPFEDIYPIELAGSGDGAVRVIRGFVLQPGDYEVTIVVRERAADRDRGGKRLAGVLRRRLMVPDFATGQLTTSTVVVADRITPVSEPPSPEHLIDDPYVIGGRRVEPAADSHFRPDEELIVVFLVYYPAVGLDKLFDIEVEYHFFSRSGPADAYLNRTEPQRFTPALLGPSFDPAAGQPVMAGQGVPLAGFAPGDYRLQIKVTDRVAGRTIERDVAFTVVS
jgi:hypothetical protein